MTPHDPVDYAGPETLRPPTRLRRPSPGLAVASAVVVLAGSTLAGAGAITYGLRGWDAGFAVMVWGGLVGSVGMIGFVAELFVTWRSR